MVKSKPCLYTALMVLMLLAGTSPVCAQQNRRDEQSSLRDNTRNGSLLSLGQIKANVVPAMEKRGAKFIGAEYDAPTMRYRLKFVRQSSVIWIDVDGRSGAVVAQAGN
jgi:hypothetical protein